MGYWADLHCPPFHIQDSAVFMNKALVLVYGHMYSTCCAAPTKNEEDSETMQLHIAVLLTLCNYKTQSSHWDSDQSCTLWPHPPGVNIVALCSIHSDPDPLYRISYLLVLRKFGINGNTAYESDYEDNPNNATTPENCIVNYNIKNAIKICGETNLVFHLRSLQLGHAPHAHAHTVQHLVCRHSALTLLPNSCY